jgi:hypothetical protein
VQSVVIKNSERADGFLDELGIKVMARDIKHRPTPTHHGAIMSR